MDMMEFIDQDRLQAMCDYSFGDHGGTIGGEKGKVPQAFVKKANLKNEEFVEFANKNEGHAAVLFIDNLRLYHRPIKFADWEHKKPSSELDLRWMDLFADEDLLDLCAQFPKTYFIIFTALEDIPLDEYIRIPPNVLSISACNAVYLPEKVKPWPHGLNRIMRNRYISSVHLRMAMDRKASPSKWLYVNHREDTGTRGHIRGLFSDKLWATVSPRVDYPDYLDALCQHKFVLCPSGNGIDSARNWETLYMGRIPIFKDHPYMRELFKNFPAIFVNDWDEVTFDLLQKNEGLLDLAQNNESKLDLQQLFFEHTGFRHYDKA